MPKRVHKIEAFEGGINQLGDPRDIDDSQFEELFNADVSRLGKITLPGNALQIYSTTNAKNETVHPGIDSNSMDNNAGGLTPGYGLFAFSADHALDGTNTQSSEFIVYQSQTNFNLVFSHIKGRSFNKKVSISVSE